MRPAFGNEADVGNQPGGKNGGGFIGNATFGVLDNLCGLRAHAGFLSLDQFREIMPKAFLESPG